jgi:uracil-xanthine permease
MTDTVSADPGEVTLSHDPMPVWKYFALGGQHVLAMAGGTILGPLLMGFDPNVAVFCSGAATILFFMILKGRIPSYLGSSFSFIAAVAAATAYSGNGFNTNIDIALSGIMAAGALYALTGVIVIFTGHAWIDRVFPPLVTGTIVAAIGVNLAGAAVQQLSGSLFNMLFGLFSLFTFVFMAVRLPKGIVNFSVLVALVFCYAAYVLCTDLLHLGPPVTLGQADLRLFGVPHFTFPRFDLAAITLIAPVFVVLVAENLGHIKAIGTMTETDLSPYVGKAFAADGAATLLAGLVGGTAVTTYAENIGVMSMTRNFNSLSFAVAGLIAMVLGVSPFFGTLVRSIPDPILGGMSFVLFGLIVGAALRIWLVGAAREIIAAQRVDGPPMTPETLLQALGRYTTVARAMTIGVPLVISAGDLTIKAGNYAFGGITMATVTALVLNHVLVGRVREAEARGS